MVVTQLARSVVAHFGMCLAKGRRRDTPYQAGRVWCVCVWKNTLACALSKPDNDTHTCFLWAKGVWCIHTQMLFLMEQGASGVWKHVEYTFGASALLWSTHTLHTRIQIRLARIVHTHRILGDLLAKYCVCIVYIHGSGQPYIHTHLGTF